MIQLQTDWGQLCRLTGDSCADWLVTAVQTGYWLVTVAHCADWLVTAVHKGGDNCAVHVSAVKNTDASIVYWLVKAV